MSEALNERDYRDQKALIDAADRSWESIAGELREKGVREGSVLAIQKSLRTAALANDDAKIPPVGVFADGDAYNSVLEAYKPWDGTNLYAELQKQIAAGAVGAMTIHAPAHDGIRERIRLSRTEAATYLVGDLATCHGMRTSKIRESRLTLAIDAAARMHKTGRGVVFKVGESKASRSGALTPREEAALAEYGGLVVKNQRVIESLGDETRWTPTEAKIREGWSSLARKALREKQHDLDPHKLRENWGFEDDWRPETLSRPIGNLAYGGDYGLASNTARYLQYGSNDMQMQLNDVWDEIAKCAFCYMTDPMCKAAVRIKSNFELGRGFTVNAVDDAVQDIIDEYDQRYTLQKKKGWRRSALITGENFLRIQALGDGRIKTSRLPERTIWYVVTLAQDPDTILYFVQRYRTAYQPMATPDNPAEYIDRIIPAEEVLHYKLNADLGETRGRSDIYAALPWHFKYRDHWEAQIEKDYASAAYTNVAFVEGNEQQVRRFIETSLPKRRPKPGSTLVFNSKVKDYKVVSSDKNSPSGTGSTNEGILNALAANYGIAKEYLGVSGNRTRGGAVVSEGPAQKTFEDGQDDYAELLRLVYQAAIDEALRAGILPAGVDQSFSIEYPDIIKGDMAAQVQQLVVGRNQGWVSHKTSALKWAAATEFADYDFDKEMAQIEAEKAAGIGLPALPVAFNDQVDPKSTGQDGGNQQPGGPGKAPQNSGNAPNTAGGSNAVRKADRAAESKSDDEYEEALRMVEARGDAIVIVR